VAVAVVMAVVACASADFDGRGESRVTERSAPKQKNPPLSTLASNMFTSKILNDSISTYRLLTINVCFTPRCKVSKLRFFA
jgi:hypothetical protein